MPERTHFNPKRAVARILRREPATLIFAEVASSGRLPKLVLSDFTQNYLMSPHIYDPKKDIVNTFSTALCIDAAILLWSRDLKGAALPFKLSDPAEGAQINLHLEPLFMESYKAMKADVSLLSEGSTPRPHFNLVYDSLSKWVKPSRDDVLRELGSNLNKNGTLLKVNGIDYQALLREIYLDSTAELPSYDQLFDLVRSSSAILTLPASKDVPYINDFGGLVFETGRFGDLTGKYRRDKFILETRGDIIKVILRPNVRTSIERSWKPRVRIRPEKKEWGRIEKTLRKLVLGQIQTDDPARITGCPALHGGLIDAALELYVRTGRARAIPETGD